MQKNRNAKCTAFCKTHFLQIAFAKCKIQDATYFKQIRTNYMHTQLHILFLIFYDEKVEDILTMF